MANVFRVNVLGPVPAGAEISRSHGEQFARWVGANGVRRRAKLVETDKGQRVILRQSPRWYGKVKVGNVWKRVRLFTDKTASVRRLTELQCDADQRAAGMITADADKLVLPITELAEAYINSLVAQKKDAEHVRISEWMLNRMIDVGKWQTWRDMTVSGIEKILPELAQTASYQNKFIVRAKAFIHWLLPDGYTDPLKRLKRVKEKGAKKTRERRAGADAEIQALFTVKMPDDRKLACAFAAFNGLRRNEARDLLGDDLHLDATILPLSPSLRPEAGT